MSALEKIMELAPKAVEEAERILNRSTSMNARIQMIEIVLNRAYGNPKRHCGLRPGAGRLRNRPRHCRRRSGR